MHPDKPLIAILMQREHNRLVNQAKSLERLLHQAYSEKQYPRLLEIARKWENLLTDDRGKHRVIQALKNFAETYKSRGQTLQDDYYELLFQAGLYRKSQWSTIRTCLGSFNDYMNNFGSVLPQYKKEFKKRYEPRKPLSVEEQSRILREQIQLIPHLDDPMRSKEMLELGLMDENGFVPMGKPKALQILKARDKFKQSRTGRVIDFFTRLVRG